jgi:hypothetical protein
MTINKMKKIYASRITSLSLKINKIFKDKTIQWTNITIFSIAATVQIILFATGVLTADDMKLGGRAL